MINLVSNCIYTYLCRSKFSNAVLNFAPVPARKMWRSAIVARWHFAPLEGHRHSKMANNDGHVANEPKAFCTNGLRT